MADLLDVSRLGEFFDEAQTSLFRLETLDYYEPDREQFERWAAGEPLDKTQLQPWLDQLRAERERGLRRRRVHVLRSPVGAYLRFECEAYARSAEAGEEIAILDLAEKLRPDGLIEEDFWLKDDCEVLLMHYGEDGSFIGGERQPPETLSRYRAARDAAWGAAEPLALWWAAHPEYHRDRPQPALRQKLPSSPAAAK